LPATPGTSESVLATRVLRFRLKDKHATQLRAMARDANLIWNYRNELSAKVFERERRFIGAYRVFARSAPTEQASRRCGS